MPLVVMCGIPCSGKTTRSVELAIYLEKELEKKVIIINEESLKLNRIKAYIESKDEKMTRGSFLAEVERMVNTETVVIIDSLNYIKGFRYELFCRARSVRTSVCLVYCDVPKEIAIEWNNNRKDEENKWPQKLLEELASRFEIPNQRNRWDRPLFIMEQDAKIPFDDIKAALFGNLLPNRNLATEFNKVEDTNLLYEMDQRTQAIISSILSWQNTSMIGEVTVPHTTQKVVLKRKVAMPELSRLRRQFTKMTSKSPLSINDIGTSFVIYLNTNLS